VSKKERPMLWPFVLEWTTTSDCRANFHQKLACRSDGADSPWGHHSSLRSKEKLKKKKEKFLNLSD